MEAVSQVAERPYPRCTSARSLEKAGKGPTSKGMPCARTIAASEKWAIYRLFGASCAESRTAVNTTASRAGYLGNHVAPVTRKPRIHRRLGAEMARGGLEPPTPRFSEAPEEGP